MTLEGFDVSHYQAPLTAASVAHLKSDGYVFCGIKCSEGSYTTDSHFAQNREACRANAFPRFVYHEQTTEPAGGQLARIMEATGGHLYPRERLALVLGDFTVPPALALDLAARCKAGGPAKHAGGKVWRPDVVLYANRSNFQSVYTGSAFEHYSKWVAAFPGDGTECKFPNAVCHQWSDHDMATHGDGDRWCSDSAAAMMSFFRG